MTKIEDVLLFGALALVWGTASQRSKSGSKHCHRSSSQRPEYCPRSFYRGGAAQPTPVAPRTKADLALIFSNGILVIGAHFAFSFIGQSYVTVVSLRSSSVSHRSSRRSSLSVSSQQNGSTSRISLTVCWARWRDRHCQCWWILRRTTLGIGLLLASAVVFALGSVLTERWSAGLPTMALHAWSMVTGRYSFTRQRTPIQEQRSKT